MVLKLLKNNESIQIKQRRFAFNKSRQQQFELNLIELERNYQNNHDLAYNERSKTMMIDHHLFLTLDLLSPEICTQLFMFTPVEHRICEQLLEGKTTKEIALAHEIQADTVKKHLQAIFKKTKTHRQSELIQLLMQFL